MPRLVSSGLGTKRQVPLGYAVVNITISTSEGAIGPFTGSSSPYLVNMRRRPDSAGNGRSAREDISPNRNVTLYLPEIGV